MHSNPLLGFYLNPGGSRVLEDISKSSTAIDFLGMNAYQDVVDASKDIESSWSKPFVVAEWGSDGRWQVGETVFDAEVETTSSEKAMMFQERYQKGIQSIRNCVGFLVFFGGLRIVCWLV